MSQTPSVFAVGLRSIASRSRIFIRAVTLTQNRCSALLSTFAHKQLSQYTPTHQAALAKYSRRVIFYTSTTIGQLSCNSAHARSRRYRPQPCGLVTYNPITNYGTNSLVYIVTTFLIVTVISKLFIRRMSGIE